MGTDRILDGIEKLLIISCQQLIVNIHRDNDDGLSLVEDENGMVSVCALEANLDKEGMCQDWLSLAWHRLLEPQTWAQPLGWPLSHQCLG